MQGKYTLESCEEFTKKLSQAIKANYILQELLRWIDAQLEDVEPSDWANLSAVRNQIRELEDK